MSQLTPGVPLIYERVGDCIYARELGSAPNTRKLIGYKLPQSAQSNSYYTQHWPAVLAMCETDDAMRALLEQLFVLYNLKKCNDQ